MARSHTSRRISAEQQSRLPISRSLLLGVSACCAWAVIAFTFAEALYGPAAIVASCLSFIGTVGFLLWNAPVERESVRIVGIVVAGQTFMNSGLSVLRQPDAGSNRLRATEEGYTFAVTSAVVFAACFLVGVWFAGGVGKQRPARPLEWSGPTATTAWVLACATALVSIAVGTGVAKRLGVLPMIFLSPSLIIPLLVARGLSGRSARGPVLILLGSQLFLMIKSSMLGLLAAPLRDVVLTFVAMRRRIPKELVVLVVVGFAVLNPAKALFRQELEGRRTMSFEEAVGVWERALDDTWSQQTIERRDRREQALGTTTSRLDLNWGSAHVYAVVPDKLPHQYGGTYADIPMLMVPRIIYPDKPTSDGYTRSRWLVEIGIQDPRSTDTVAISLPASAEAYWNFGWLGVFIVPLGLGVVVGLLLRAHIADPIGRAAWLVLIATTCTGFHDMLVWTVPHIIIGAINVVLVNFFCGVGRTRIRTSSKQSPPAPPLQPGQTSPLLP